MTILSASKLGLLYGDVEVFSGINLEVPDHARIGIVGPNGSGKSSLLKIIVGELEPSEGNIYRTGGVRIGYVPQVPVLSTQGSLRDEIMTAFNWLLDLEDAIEDSLEAVAQASPEQLAQAQATYATLVERYEGAGGYNYESRMEQVAAGIGLPAESLASPAASASGGERTRAALAQSLLANPDLLVLDEPTNYLDLEGLNWLERFLSHCPNAFLVVSHDRYFLDQVVSHIWELDHERLQTFTGNYSKYRVLKGEKNLWQRRRFQRQQEYIAKEEDFIRRYGAGQRAREAKGREKRLNRMERVTAVEKDQSMTISHNSVGRTGLVTLRTQNLKIGFHENGETRELFTMPDARLERGSRTAILGNNGTGKTTLIRTLMGLTPALAGEVTLGHQVQIGYFRQEIESIPAESTVFEALLDVRNLPLEEARAYLARFLFRGEDVFQSVSSLSGGQRSRLALARLLINEPNLLILDEPSTHLDIATREALEQVLLDFPGTLLLVSHDRHLVNLMAQQMWILSDGNLELFPGTFAEWEQKKQQEAAAESRQQRSAPSRRDPSRQNDSQPKRNPPKRNPPTAPKINLEQVITDLETRLQEIEAQLQTASESQDLTEVARLGEEHIQVTQELETRWNEWSD